MDTMHERTLSSANFCLKLSPRLHKIHNPTSSRLRLGGIGAHGNPGSGLPTPRTGWRNGFARATHVLRWPLGLFNDGGKVTRCSVSMASSPNSNRLAGRLFGPGDGSGEEWWDDKCIFHPVVVRDPASSTWRMYYYGRNRDAWSSGVTPALLSTGRVGLAISQDGVHWNRHKGPLPQGAILDPDEGADSFDSVHVGCSDILFHNGQWWMFYFGGSAEKMELGPPGAKPFQGFRMLPGLVKSADGIVFDRASFTGNPLLNVGRQSEWDEVFVAWPRVLPPRNTHRPQDSTWLMTYSSMEKQAPPFSSIGIATSGDGNQWTKAGKALTRGAPGSWDEGGVGRRHVLLIRDQYAMFYEGVDKKGIHGIGLAISSDGIRWKKDHGGPVFTARVGEDAWDNGTVAAPHLVPMDDGSFRLYYVSSNDSKSETAIGMAVSEGHNFRSWIRL